MAQIIFKTLRDWGMDTPVVKDYNTYVKSINLVYTVIPWGYILKINISEDDTEETITSLVKMISLLRPHIVRFEFCEASNVPGVSSMVTDLETTMDYFGYTNINSSELILTFGLTLN